MKLVNIDGLKTAIINIFIDPENGFSRFDIRDENGGSLYVPQGEQVTPIMGEVIKNSKGSVFIIGQDYHPRNHISFMVNHPGIMEYRIEKFKEFLAQNGQPVPETKEELYERSQQPVHFLNGFDQPPVPFSFPEIVLDENRNIMGLKEADGRIREVRVETSSGLEPNEKDRGRVTKVLDEYHRKTFDQYRAEGRLLSTQTLWTMHCVQGTESCLYPPDLSLPQGLQDKLRGDMASRIIYHRDEQSGNEFYVVRKGQNPELDSYGIGVENDGETLTPAWEMFSEISGRLKRLGCQNVVINIGGLATNFCTEFSANNVNDFLAGHFKMRGMKTKINFVPEISRGIPVPGGVETPFSLAGTEERLAQRGINAVSVEEIIAMSPKSNGIHLNSAFPPPGR